MAQYLVFDAGSCGDQIQVILALQPLLDDVHMQQAQESAAEPQVQGHGGFGLVDERGIVQVQLFQRVAQRAIVLAIHGIKAGKDHRLGRAIARQRLARWLSLAGERIAHAAIAHALEAGSHITHLTGAQLGHRLHRGGKDAHLQRLELPLDGHHHQRRPRPDHPIHHPHIGDDTLVGVIV